METIMEWYEQWAHEPYIDVTDVLLHLPICNDPDCLTDPDSCLRYCVPEIDHGAAKKQFVRELDLRLCMPTHFERLYRHLGRKREVDPDGYVRLALMVRSVEMRILRPYMYDNEDPQPPAILYQGGKLGSPIATRVVLDDLIPSPVCSLWK
jgi:hypothetical protein